MKTSLERFKRAILPLGETQRERAERLGIKSPYLCDILLGNRRLTGKILSRLEGGKIILLQQAREEAEREWDAAK